MAISGSVAVGDYLRTKTGIHLVESLDFVGNFDQDATIIYLSNGGFEYEHEVNQDDILLESEVY
jgi:hypothetical protein